MAWTPSSYSCWFHLCEFQNKGFQWPLAYLTFGGSLLHTVSVTRVCVCVCDVQTMNSCSINVFLSQLLLSIHFPSLASPEHLEY